ncbi:MAG: RNA polymerase sigma factor [Planctomycetes bacterium]|nr:RNA polymerase sigma factor [Planctomycetota bacterium]
MLTAELKLPKPVFITSRLALFLQNATDVDYALDNPPEQVDSRDITEILNGNRDAFTELIKRYQNQVTAKMWRFTRDRTRLEELVQDVFVEAYGSLRSFKQGSPFLPWLMKIAVRTGYRYWKKTARTLKDQRSLEGLDEIIISKDKIKPDRAAEIIHSMLDTLPPKDRLALTLTYFEECSVKEVAELTGWSLIMTKVRLHRARGKLKKLITEKMSI